MTILIIVLIIAAAVAAYCAWALRHEARVETDIALDAPAHRVWAVLTDFDAYGEWNPLIVAISGQLAEQERLEVALARPDGTTVRLRAAVLRVSPARQIRMLARLGPGGLVNAEHYFVLEPGDGTTRLVHGLRYTGVGLPAFGSRTVADERELAAMNRALADRVAAAR